MPIEIHRHEVLDNIIRFRNNLLETRKKKEELLGKERSYTALVNRHTGDIRFALNLKELKQKEFADWQEIHFLVQETAEKISFNVSDEKGTALLPSELDPIALRILFETLDALNKLAALYHRQKTLEILPEDAALQDLSSIHLSEISKTAEILETMPGWAGKISRLDAEKKLLPKEIGSYLLREPQEIEKEVVEQFSKTNRVPVEGYILTFLEEKKKISEFLCIHTKHGWAFCHDLADLNAPIYQYYPTLQALLASLQGKIKNPI